MKNINKNMFNERLEAQLCENYEPDCEDFWLAEIETKSKLYDVQTTKIKELIRKYEFQGDTLYFFEGFAIKGSKQQKEAIKRRNYIDEIISDLKGLIGDSDE